MCDIFSWGNMGNLGSLIGGLSALIAVFSWRTDQRVLKKSEAAFEAIIGCEKLKLLLADYTGYIMQTEAKAGPEESECIEKFKETYRNVRNQNISNLEAYNSGYLKAMVFLKGHDDITILFKEIEKNIGQLREDLSFINLNLNDSNERENLNKKRALAFGQNAKQERETKINELIEKLKSIAILENFAVHL